MIERILIYDPIPFKGGSKEVMKTILTALPSDLEVWIVSNDEVSWDASNVNFVRLFSPSFLLNQTNGIGYFLKHLLFLFSLLLILCKLKRFTKIIGISGPCVDFSLYLLTELITIDVIQLVQGNIAKSRIANFGLIRAKQIFYLPSTRDSILNSLNTQCKHKRVLNEKFSPFINGIDCSTIKKKVNNDNVGFLWAASLTRWKKVELFINAMNKLNSMHLSKDNYYASVCYIKPQNDTYIDIASLDKIDNVHWFNDPLNLNDIRANSSVFISTSEHEPFGLSILESMAAGLAIVIPADNAYWDQHLIDGWDCIKYSPNNTLSLVNALNRLINNPALLLKISKQAQLCARDYCHLRCYAHILKVIPN
jgi:glycosyltransferase involved in cell wall biosynthesis